MNTKNPCRHFRINRDEYTSRFHPIWPICRCALFIETITESPDRIGVTRERSSARFPPDALSLPSHASFSVRETRSAYCFSFNVLFETIIAPKRGKSSIFRIMPRHSCIASVIGSLNQQREAPIMTPLACNYSSVELTIPFFCVSCCSSTQPGIQLQKGS